jgi:hypothetical protein
MSNEFLGLNETRTGMAGILLDEYQGTYRLVQGFQSNNPDFKDKPKMNFCYPSMANDEVGKTAVPMGVSLGDSKEEAIKTLKDLIFKLS